MLDYREDVAGKNVKSDSTSFNMVCRATGQIDWKHIRCSITGIAPLYTGIDREKWKRSGNIVQKNDLKYAWYRVEGRMGYIVNQWLVLYTGLRWSEFDQKRDRFEAAEEAESMGVKERVFDFAVPGGICGETLLTDTFRLTYDMRYYYSIRNKVKNSYFEDLTIRNIDARSMAAEIGLKWQTSDYLSISILSQWEMLYRDESPWEDAGDYEVKYPKNATRMLMFSVTALWQF